VQIRQNVRQLGHDVRLDDVDGSATAAIKRGLENERRGPLGGVLGVSDVLTGP